MGVAVAPWAPRCSAPQTLTTQGPSSIGECHKIRFVTKTVHAFLDDPVALSLVATPFLLGFGHCGSVINLGTISSTNPVPNSVVHSASRGRDRQEHRDLADGPTRYA